MALVNEESKIESESLSSIEADEYDNDNQFQGEELLMYFISESIGPLERQAEQIILSQVRAS